MPGDREVGFRGGDRLVPLGEMGQEIRREGVLRQGGGLRRTAELFYEDFIAALNVAAALVAAPRELAYLLDAAGGLALERVDRIAIKRLEDPES